LPFAKIKPSTPFMCPLSLCKKEKLFARPGVTLQFQYGMAPLSGKPAHKVAAPKRFYRW
jgi:hypothetical protein